MPAPIIVPLDGSHLAEVAIPHAIDRARADGAPLLLVRAVSFPPIGLYLETFDSTGSLYQAELDAEVKEAEEYLAQQAADLVANGLTVNTLCKVGDAGKVVLEAAKDAEAELIVIATHGRSGLQRWFFGSVAEAILREAPIPVLLIRSGAARPAHDDAPGHDPSQPVS